MKCARTVNRRLITFGTCTAFADRLPRVYTILCCLLHRPGSSAVAVMWKASCHMRRMMINVMRRSDQRAAYNLGCCCCCVPYAGPLLLTSTTFPGCFDKPKGLLETTKLLSRNTRTLERRPQLTGSEAGDISYDLGVVVRKLVVL